MKKHQMVLTRFFCMIIAVLILCGTGCSKNAQDAKPEESEKPVYVYPGETTVMTWKNPAFNQPEYSEGTELSFRISPEFDKDREYSYSGTVHWIENQGNHIFSLLCLPKDYDGNQTYPLLIWGHGFNATFREIDYYANFLTDAGYALLAFDFRGGHSSNGTTSAAGKSDGKMIQMSLDTKLSDLKAVLSFSDSLPMIDHDKLVYIGHSQGGTMGVVAGCDNMLRERFSGMLLLAPSYPMNYLELFETVDNFPAKYKVMWCDVGKDYLYSYVRYNAHAREEDPKYGKPVLVLHGDRDTVTSEEDSMAACNAFGENARFETVLNGLHDFRDDVLPQLIPEVILPFLQSVIE